MWIISVIFMDYRGILVVEGAYVMNDMSKNKLRMINEF